MNKCPPVHLITCLGVEDDLPLLGHFLDHYIGLGVSPARIHVIINAPNAEAPGVAQARAELAARGAPEGELWTEPYTSGGMWARRRDLQERVAAPKDWVIQADVDEFHEYPEDLDLFLRWCERKGATAVQGPFIDRLAPGGRLAPVTADRPLVAQFPIEAEVMCAIGKEKGVDDAHGTVKLMVMRGSVAPGLGGHGPAPGGRAVPLAGQPLDKFRAIKSPAFRFAVPMRVHHFKWTEPLLQGLERRLATPGASEAGSRYGRRLLDYFVRNGSVVSVADVTIKRRGLVDIVPWKLRLVVLRRIARIEKRFRRQLARLAKARST